ncbi:MAG: phosphoribosylaminoimidazolesuccinocarboxamide synthase [Planctomycetota bacterium]|nr:phosphoribosylaminoimidazolesuccinocarboxamide synthase [Planctomycetota bacterium]
MNSSCSTAPASGTGYPGGLAIPGWNLVYRGKVRDVYHHASHPGMALMVASDRLSAFDVVMKETVPDRGRILTHITEHWLRAVENWMPAARVTVRVEEIPDLPDSVHAVLRGRSTWTRLAERLNVEVVLRGWLAGSGWREYEATGRLWEHALPSGLQNASRLPEVLHTPTTKAEKDEPIDWKQAEALIGSAAEAARVHEIGLRLFQQATTQCQAKGVVLADTKFEFGRVNGELVLIDEVLTPDSSRYWPADRVVAGQEPPSWDKEIVRSYLRSLKEWNRKPPPPPIPAEVIAKTRSQYLEICTILTGSLPEGITG